LFKHCRDTTPKKLEKGKRLGSRLNIRIQFYRSFVSKKGKSMAIQKIRIHPAIGIARVGNSAEYFVGPLTPDEIVPPPGGYKSDPTSFTKVKRQAAQFRLYAYDEQGNWKEITAADATITWTVHLANSKAKAPKFADSGLRNSGITGPARDKLVINPGARTITGRNGSADFSNGTITFPNRPARIVPLGEIKTDDAGRLLVLGGTGTSASPTGQELNSTFNNDGWYDDVADGPVSAEVKIGSQTFKAEGSWVIVGPAKFAPEIPNSTTLWDRMRQHFIDIGLLPPIAPNYKPSYTKEIYPILLSAIDVGGVNKPAGPRHQWNQERLRTDAALRNRIFDKLTTPSGGGGNMPLLRGPQPSLTKTQYEVMRRWKDGNFINDSPTPPVITPDGLDQASLQGCVGASFFPGIEAGQFLIDPQTPYAAPFRLNHARVAPGDVTARMALPWQTDFLACADNWWPPQRPNQVVRGQDYQYWSAGITNGKDMVARWSYLGFVIRTASGFKEVERSPVLGTEISQEESEERQAATDSAKATSAD
jgi:hypothetical protein